MKMPKFEVLASQVIYLSAIVEAESKDKAWEIAINGGSWEDYEAERIIYSDTIEIEGDKNA
jgi:hypothetical protein